MKLSQANQLTEALSTMLQAKGIVGFKIAYNFRKLNEELIEYNQIKQDLFRKYGEEANGQLVINKMSENYSKFIEDIAPYENEEIEVSLKTVSEEELQQSDLTASQMLVLMEYMGNV